VRAALLIALASAATLAFRPLQAQQAQLLAWGTVAADALDCKGDTLGGFGSAATYAGSPGHYYFAADGSSGSKHSDYRPRFHEGVVDVHGQGLSFELVRSVWFVDSAGEFFSSQHPTGDDTEVPRRKDGRRCLSPEAIAVAPDGSLYLAEELGPFLYQFDTGGRMLRCLKPPPYYLPRNQAGRVVFSAEEPVAAGRVPNRGFEGLALTLDGSRAVMILQSPLAQDGGRDGRFSRILVLDLTSGNPVAEYPYEMGPVGLLKLAYPREKVLKQNDLGACELAALRDGTFLVLERDNRGADGSESPSPAQHKRVYVVDLKGATNVLGHAGALNTVRDLVPVKKRSVLDLVSASSTKGAFSRAQLAEKWEGMALAPGRDQSHPLLLLASDNDFRTPTLHIGGNTIPNRHMERPQPTQLLLFELNLAR
jgi:hypothetical protein